MDIKMHEVKVRDLIDGYANNFDNGVVAYGGKLNVRPAYQREFVYGDKEQKAVINTIMSGFPLNTLYWVVKEDGTYELLDGQQRTMSICEYVDGNFSVDVKGSPKAFGNLSQEMQDKILDYKLTIYFCSGGSRDEQLDWFEVINIAGLKLTDQELRNAIYTGTWLTDAKRYFSKRNCAGSNISKDLVSLSGDKSVDRQGLLETAIKWIADRDGVTIKEYMAAHQHDPNANDLWLHFNSVINWVNVIFPNYRKEMKGIDWGGLYLRHKDDPLDAKTLEVEVSELMQDPDVTKRSGIYYYVLDREEKALSIRAFNPRDIRAAYEKQKGLCVKCGNHFEIEEMQADHITPWSKGGHTTPDNLQMLCADCNRKKSNI